MYKVFISHSSKDKAIVDIFVDVILENGMGFRHADIFCTSIEGMGIKTGEDWRSTIKSSLLNSEIVLLIITPYYKESEICLNEMGAAWATDKKVIPIIVPPITFSTIGVTFDTKQSLRLTDETDLDDLCDRIVELLSIEKSRLSRWNSKKNDAIKAIAEYLSSHSFPTPLSRDVMEKLEKKLTEIKGELKLISDENKLLREYIEKLEKVKDKGDSVSAKRDVGLLPDYEEFDKLSNAVSAALKQLDPIVRTAIFNEFTKNELQYDRSYNGSSISSNMAKKLIDDDLNCICTHPLIKKALDALTVFKKFFEGVLSPETFEMKEREHSDISFAIDSLDFWESVFNTKLEYES